MTAMDPPAPNEVGYLRDLSNKVQNAELRLFLELELGLLEDGDIVCFQKSLSVQGSKRLRCPDVPSFFEYRHNLQMEIFNIRLPKESTVADVLSDLRMKAELSHPNAELRLLEVFTHRIYKSLQRSGIYVAWEQYLGLEHSDNSPKRSLGANQYRPSHEKAVKIYN
ncbi:UNVERIFIED_CONTAM: Ubiquitin carboxyl-terminal hydrolase 12 [Sesamum radiatum]|uniref:Ubiquitin carboxyl-terminal hydrolase 12 n=1 Tax=Sesamum radiatum TaxID=300843 RepID=A0AAW2W775_SESRA